MEISNNPVELYKTRSPAITHEDPVAKAQSLIRWFHSAQPTDVQFAARITTLEDQLLGLALYGEMSDAQRGNLLLKLSKQLFEAQKHHEQLLHRDKEIELKRQGNLIKATRLQEEMKRAKERKAEAASGGEPV